MQERDNKIIVIFSIILLLLVVYVLHIGRRVYDLQIKINDEYELVQSLWGQINDSKEQINRQQGTIAYLYEKITGEDSEPLLEFRESVGEVYSYLAIGNSITMHGISDVWHAEYGMAASAPEQDYYHIVCKYLEKKNGTINSVAYNYSVWEVQSHDRSETWEFLDRYLVQGIDLITVQLSENVYDMTEFSADFRSLIDHIMEITPDAMIIVVDDFWSTEKHDLKADICKEKECPFADLSDIRGIEYYYAGIGETVYGEDGLPHVIEHDGVARHPGDEGMKEIAERIIELIHQ